jgi:uncharacterized protein YecE (DUF72 family)
LADAQSNIETGILHIGTMGWSYGFWKGSFYPEDCKAKEFLTYFSRRFNSVEVDSSFYRIPSLQALKDWKKQSSDNFKFSLKFPQKITHFKMLENAEEETQIFLDHVDLLGEKLGILLLQFPPMFRQQHFSLLKNYLDLLPQKYQYALEVRNKSLLNDQVYALLRDHNIALVWVDAVKMPLVSEMTANHIFVRWEGDRKAVKGDLGKTEVDRAYDIKLWAEKLKLLRDKEIQVFGYFSKYYSGFPPNDVKELLKSL